MRAPLFKRAVIAGVGLIGGSLAIAGKKAGLFGSVAGLGRSRENLDKALEMGLVDEVFTDIDKAVDGADLFFAATPVETIPSVCLSAARNLPAGCIVTDGGSVKGEIVKQLEGRLPSSLEFVGGHPIAGSEKSGAQAASASLFDGKRVILTPTGRTGEQALERISHMWEAVGAIVETMSAQKHDEVMALVSHLPHVTAYALVDAVCGADPDGVARRFVAGGLKDTTRIAASDPAMWRDILSMNRGNILVAIGKLEKSLAKFRKDIEEKDFDALVSRLEKVRSARLALEKERADT